MNHYFKLYHVHDIHVWLNRHTSVRIGMQVCAVLMFIKAIMGFATTLLTFSSMKDKFLSSTSMPLPYLIFEYFIQVLTFFFTALALTLFTLLMLEEGTGLMMLLLRWEQTVWSVSWFLWQTMQVIFGENISCV